MKKVLYKLLIISVFLFLFSLIVSLNNAYAVTITVSHDGEGIDPENGVLLAVGQTYEIEITFKHKTKNSLGTYIDYYSNRSEYNGKSDVYTDMQIFKYTNDLQPTTDEEIEGGVSMSYETKIYKIEAIRRGYSVALGKCKYSWGIYGT